MTIRGTFKNIKIQENKDKLVRVTELTHKTTGEPSFEDTQKALNTVRAYLTVAGHMDNMAKYPKSLVFENPAPIVNDCE